MIFKLKKSKVKTQWHTWFAWHPVEINNAIFFLENIERKGEVDEANKEINDNIIYHWQYRITPKLKENTND